MAAVLVRVHAAEEVALALRRVLAPALPVGHRQRQHLEHAAARVAGAVERAAADERLEHALVGHLRVDAGAEVEDRLEAPALVPRRDDRLDGADPDALHGVHAEADLALDHGEPDDAGVDVRRQHLDAHLVALVDVERHLVLGVHDARDQGRHVLDRVVGLEPGGAVADHRVAGGVALVERVVAGGLEVRPHLVGHRRRHVLLGEALHEGLLEGGHQLAGSSC